MVLVSDVCWIRWAARLESALLPGIHYELYTSAARAQALAWVEGRSELPHRPGLTFIATDNPDVVGFALDGRIGTEEMHRLSAHVRMLLTCRPGRVSVLGRFAQFSFPALGGIDAEYVKMKLSALERVERYAIGGGPPWLGGLVTAAAPLLKLELRHFAPEEEDAAWHWLGSRPQEEVALADLPEIAPE